MILAFNIGNNVITLGCFLDSKLLFSSKLSSDRCRTADEYALAINGLLSIHGIKPSEIEGGILSSVVPSLKNVLCKAAFILTGKELMVVGSGLKTGLNIRTDSPQSLGSDMVVNAVAALARYPVPIAIFDMGTATTVSVIDKQKAYVGGMIIPGLQLSVDALSSHAAQLPNVEIIPPERLIGITTAERMHSGAMYGCASMIDGLTERLEESLGGRISVVLTGDNADIIAPLCRKKLHYAPNLLLEGLLSLYDKNRYRQK